MLAQVVTYSNKRLPAGRHSRVRGNDVRESL